MTGWLPEIEGWLKAAAILVGVVMAVLVPVRSWIVEDRRYRAQTSAEPAAPSPTISPGIHRSDAGDPPDMDRLISAIRECADAIRGLTRLEQRRGDDRLADALNRLADRS